MKKHESLKSVVCISLVLVFVVQLLPTTQAGAPLRAFAAWMVEEAGGVVLGSGATGSTLELPEAEDMDTLVMLKGSFFWSGLTENERDIVLGEYDISLSVMEQLEENGITLQRSLGCLYVLGSTTLTIEETLLVDASYEQAHYAVMELKKLERRANTGSMPVCEYSAIREGIVSGSTMDDMLETLGPGSTINSIPAKPDIDLACVAPYPVRSGGNESVSLNTGALSLQYPLVSLQGVNGLDADLCVRYDSSKAGLYKIGTGANYNTIYGFKEIYKGYYYNSVNGVRYASDDRCTALDYADELWYSSSSAANSDSATYQDFYVRRYDLDYDVPYIEWQTVSNQLGITLTRMIEYNYPSGTKTGNTVPYAHQTTVPAPTYIDYNKNGYSGRLYETHRTETTTAGAVVNNRYWETITARVYYGGTVLHVSTKGYHFYQQAAPEKWPSGEYIATTSALGGYYAATTSPTYLQKTGDIGAGWSWNIPSYDTGSRVLHLGDGATLEINSNLTFKDYPPQDMVFTSGTGFKSGALSSSYKLCYSDGMTVWFYSDGRCIGVSDRFDNRIYYKYTTGANGYRLSKVTDAAGRETNITYQPDSVTVTAPDGKATVLALTAHNGCNILSGITAPAQPAMTFEYSYDNAYFYLNNCGGANNVAANLVRVNHPAGGKTQYTYSPHQEGIGSGYSTAYKVSSRKDIIGAAGYAARTYTDYGKYTGYPNYSKQADLPSNYTYTVTETDAGGLSAVHTFNNKGLQASGDTKTGAAAQVQKRYIQYDSYRLPVKTTTQQYTGLPTMRGLTSL